MQVKEFVYRGRNEEMSNTAMREAGHTATLATRAQYQAIRKHRCDAHLPASAHYEQSNAHKKKETVPPTPHLRMCATAGASCAANATATASTYLSLFA